MTTTTTTEETSRASKAPLLELDNVSLQLGHSEVLGLVGESGCGKSTLAKLICGLEKTAGGTITFASHPVKPLGLGRRPKNLLGVQMVFQNPYASLNPRRRIRDQLTDALTLDPEHNWTVESLLEAVDLPLAAAQRFSHSFSGGQRQRIAIARALAAGPKVLVGDEPIASLDAFLQARIARMMRDLAIDSGASMIFISHDLSVVRDIADRVAVMEAGNIVEVGSTGQIWNDPQHPYTKKLLAAIPKVDGPGADGHSRFHRPTCPHRRRRGRRRVRQPHPRDPHQRHRERRSHHRRGHHHLFLYGQLPGPGPDLDRCFRR